MTPYEAIVIALRRGCTTKGRALAQAGHFLRNSRFWVPKTDLEDLWEQMLLSRKIVRDGTEFRATKEAGPMLTFPDHVEFLDRLFSFLYGEQDGETTEDICSELRREGLDPERTQARVRALIARCTEQRGEVGA